MSSITTVIKTEVIDRVTKWIRHNIVPLLKYRRLKYTSDIKHALHLETDLRPEIYVVTDPQIKFRVTPRLNRNAGNTILDSSTVRRRLETRFPLFINGNPLIDPIGVITYDDDGEITIEINTGFLPPLSSARLTSIKNEIRAWSEFVRIDPDSA